MTSRPDVDVHTWALTAAVEAVLAHIDAHAGRRPPDQPAPDRPAPDQPASDQPASDQPASDQPASDQPASDQPASDRPAADRPAPAQHRRIGVLSRRSRSAAPPPHPNRPTPGAADKDNPANTDPVGTTVTAAGVDDTADTGGARSTTGPATGAVPTAMAGAVGVPRATSVRGPAEATDDATDSVSRLDTAGSSGTTGTVGGASAGGAADTGGTTGAGGVAALDVLCSCYGLTSFERDVLVLAAAAEIDPSTGPRCAAASGGRAYPTFSLALAALPDPHWAALTPVAPLRRCRLVELDDPGAVTLSRLRIDERILHYLAGLSYLDVRLHGVVSRVEAPAGQPDSQRRAAAEVAAGWAAAGRDGRPHVDLVGADPQTRREVAAAAARSAGLGLYAVDAADLPGDPAERDALAGLWERESVLLPGALLVEMVEPAPERRAVAEAFIAGLEVPVIVSSADPLPTLHRHRRRVAVPPLTQAEQQELWRSALRLTGGAAPGLDEIVAQFSLPAHTIRVAGDAAWRLGGANGSAAERAPDLDPGELTRRAWQAGLAEARIALDELGRRIEPRARWDDLVVPTQQRTVLREIVAHVRQRATVYQAWGFASVLRRGLGVTALFAGASGTGKTLAAEVVAAELELDLFVIDLSQVVSKYIGETEKNLRKVFDAAERGGAVLLFDEADALFGKRSEVKDSHDRYANLEISYLLMRMEAYRGLAILTTNMKQALDPAFMRRIRFLVDFPFPGPEERAEIWRRVIPREVPAAGLDTGRLAQLAVSGGAIRNIALSAAFLAADEGSPLRMRHVRAAARTEYLKLERSLTPGEVAGWD